ncbi:general amidase [Blastomyces dermatitidis ER-3]|uniref:General amidase n=2 Tax=Ajellomyces dermatitidis TaxID=5039 RepID=F2TIM2_AJEDA|nr:general amidase [Blastomyces dermatitidis ER-3]EEQ92593.2 general amidase [Blastomyces dermatitidis ER-3]EGE83085.2 general amidase [Blastomyces dermatitidis ATCC 18188]
MMATGTSWETAAKAKRESILNLIPEKWRIPTPLPPASELRDVTTYIQQFLSSREIQITELDIVSLARRTTTGQWTAVEVTEAFCHRAALAHQFVNCLHEIYFAAALKDAQKLDAYFAEHKKPLGPLHGIPISLKDQFHVKGVDTTMGYVGWIGTFQGQPGDPRRLVFESELVRELRSVGAVLHCKTSVPATLMCGETVNNIIDYTWNPMNRHLSAGGSSGGEGSLILLRGSAGGFGTDIGGSVRIPAAFNGIYGIRPSAGRIPYEGAANSMDGQNSLNSVVGPLATTAGGLKLLFQSILSQKPWLQDPLAVELPWRDEVEQEVLSLIKNSAAGQGQLSFGLMSSDGYVQPLPPVARALRIMTATLMKLGHKVIEWKPPSHKRAEELAITIYTLDGGTDAHYQFSLSGEAPIPELSVFFSGVPNPQKTAHQIAAINVTKREYQKEYMEYWNSTAELTGTGRPVDGLLCPVAVFPAARRGKTNYLNYTMFVNVLDYSSIVIPVTTADKAVDILDAGYTPLNDTDKAIHDEYDAEIYDCAPVGLQLVGRRFQEEKLIALAEYLGEEVKRI